MHPTAAYARPLLDDAACTYRYLVIFFAAMQAVVITFNRRWVIVSCFLCAPSQLL